MAEYFSLTTKRDIRRNSNMRCVLCQRLLTGLGRCAHILDAAEAGKEMETFAITAGVLEPTYRRSVASNGILLCAGCHQDFLIPNNLLFCPPRQVLQFLIDFTKTNSPTPIYKILNDLRASSALRVGVPSLAPALPYLDLFSLVSLVPENLEGVQMGIYDEERYLQFLGDHRSVVPSRIHDATALSRSFVGSSGLHLLSPTTILPHHYWRLPPGITPQAVLAYVLHHVARLHSGLFDGHEEVRLAIELHGLLATHLPGCKGASGGGGYGSRNLTSLVGGGGSLPGKSKRGRKKKDPLTHSAVNTSTATPIMSTVSPIRGNTLQVRSHRFSKTFYSRTSQHLTTTTPRRTPITAVDHDIHHRFPSRRPHPHFHTQSGRVTPILKMIRRLM